MSRLTLALLVALLAAPALAAPPPRPLTGCALLTAEADGDVVVYAEPGVQRLALLPLTRIPTLARTEGGTALAALARRGRWVKIAYDDAERQGWIEAPRGWGYAPWPSALEGRDTRLLPAMKKVNYALREEPGESGAECGTLTRDQEVRILSVEEDWALSESPPGWFRWRDAEGRLTISLSARGD